ncbi:cation:proton antiporter [Brevundimonas sp. 2R-24]|uniref:Cation:proton antiporter n=1 Tax=Peiella sedimenti TaxID=3061083 RepID=A0ABT8SKT2_9CAUL|nr:cation:proton antiporter [Caulobacteraceae bacterium XZ-24]
MAGPATGEEYKDIVVFLAAAGIVAPIFRRFRISPVLGFLVAGVALGPDGLGRLAGDFPWLSVMTITDQEQIAVLAEFGVVFLLFMIGLELSWERLKAMRRFIVSLGVAQIALCALALSGLFFAMGQTLASAIVLGLGIALSSTAIVMPVLSDAGRMRTATGRASFSVLLAQDVAVAPILVAVTVLAAGAGAAGELNGGALAQGLLSLIPAAVGLGVIVLLGRLLLRPMFRSVAKAGRREMFLAACLFVVLAVGLASQAAGLSMSLGALVAGILLAETEYGREVEVLIQPFQGLLLGLFFVSVGVGLDLDAVAAAPATVGLLAVTLIAIKVAIVFALARFNGVPRGPALETALLLGPAGEFAFVIIGQAIGEGLVPRGFGQGLLLSATLSLFAIPLLGALGVRFSRRQERRERAGGTVIANPDKAAPGGVLIVGYGRVGRLVGEMLDAHGIAYTIIDSDPEVVSAARQARPDVWFGDASNPALLAACGIDEARALVITMDQPGKVDAVAAAVRAQAPEMIVIARARDEKHAARLYRLGVTDAVPETTESSLQLAENTLVDLGVPMGLVLASIHERREQFRKLFQEAAPEGRNRPLRALRASTRFSTDT